MERQKTHTHTAYTKAKKLEWFVFKSKVLSILQLKSLKANGD